jgi:hypothetical protein
MPQSPASAPAVIAADVPWMLPDVPRSVRHVADDAAPPPLAQKLLAGCGAVPSAVSSTVQTPTAIVYCTPRRVTFQPDSVPLSPRPDCAWSLPTTPVGTSSAYGTLRAASTSSRCSATPPSRALVELVVSDALLRSDAAPIMPTTTTTMATMVSTTVKPCSARSWVRRVRTGLVSERARRRVSTPGRLL